ncbi:MAG: glutathione S-transferase N-terminal domain-containing protein [Pseudomonadota bacterium]
MIDLYTWTTPNGRKVSIALEEMGLPYTAHAIDIGKDEQFAADFLAISPNNKIPAIRERETGFHLMESGAILLWLAEKSGRFLPEAQRWEAMEWLMWQMAGFGPMLGQAHHFLKYNAGVSDYAETRYHSEAQRLYRVLDTRLAGRDFILDSYSIVDMAIWPWVSRFEWQKVDLNDFPHVRDWYLGIAERPAVQRGYDIPNVTTPIPKP